MNLWLILKRAVAGYIEDNALSRGAAIAYYTVFSIGPVLIIVIAVAALVFGEEAASGAISDEISGLMGKSSADTIQQIIASANAKRSGVLATSLGFVTLIVTASSVFGEMQSALNAIWRAAPTRGAVSRLVRARLVSLGLVMSLGFLLLVSLVIGTVLNAVGTWLDVIFPGAEVVLRIANIVASYVLTAVLFAAIYKVLPDKQIAWRDVAVGAVATALLFGFGKHLLSLYLSSSSVATSYGAAGALLIVLLWIYYSSQIFLFGAEFTRAYAEIHGSHSGDPSLELGGHEGEIVTLKSDLRRASRAR